MTQVYYLNKEEWEADFYNLSIEAIKFFNIKVIFLFIFTLFELLQYYKAIVLFTIPNNG